MGLIRSFLQLKRTQGAQVSSVNLLLGLGLLSVGFRSAYSFEGFGLGFRVSAFCQAYLSLLLSFRGRFTPFRFYGFGLGPFSLGFRSGFTPVRASIWVYSF